MAQIPDVMGGGPGAGQSVGQPNGSLGVLATEPTPGVATMPNGIHDAEAAPPQQNGVQGGGGRGGGDRGCAGS
jgi:hypothetical protein